MAAKARKIAVAPMTRPSAEKPQRQDGATIVAMALAGQLGSAPKYLAKMLIDERKFTYMNDYTLTAYNYLDYRGKIDGIRFWDHFVDWELVGAQGVDGRGSRRALQALANTSGINPMEKAEKPNVVARNIWKRGWRREAEDKGKFVEE